MTNPSLSVTDELERLVALHKGGVLTDDEFKAQKAKLLNPTPATTAPPKKPRSAFKRVVLWTGLAFAAFIVFAYVDAEYPEVFMSGLPKCDSREARKMVERTVEENSVGLAQGRRIIRWIGDESREPATSNSVRCLARVALNVGGEVRMAYIFEDRDGGILINIEFN